MWKCPHCDRLISNFIHTSRKGFDTCSCGAWYWQFDQFPLDMDDTIEVIDPITERTPEQMIEKAYRDGYSRGFEEGDEEGYPDGYDDGYDEGFEEGYRYGINVV